MIVRIDATDTHGAIAPDPSPPRNTSGDVDVYRLAAQYWLVPGTDIATHERVLFWSDDSIVPVLYQAGYEPQFTEVREDDLA